MRINRFFMSSLVYILWSPTVLAVDMLGIEIGSQPTALDLAAKLGVDVQSAPGSLERMDECRNASTGGFFAAGKYKKCLNEVRVAIFPVPVGTYRAKPTAFNKLWGCLVDISIAIDGAGRVYDITANYRSAFFETLDAGARAKWGEPATRATADLQNLYGAKLTAVEEHWTVDGASISLLSNYDMARGIMTIKR